MADVTGTIGNEQVELNNAATEATLKLLLQSSLSANKQTIDQIRGLAQKNGIDVKEANDQIDQVGQQAAKGAGTFKTLWVTTNLASEQLRQWGSQIAPFVGDLINGQGKMSTAFNMASSSVSSFSPLLGMVLGGIGKIANMQEQNLNAYREMSKSGVNFAGDLNGLRLNASQLGMTLGEQTAFMKANSETLAKMGGTAEQGMQSFNTAAKELRNSDAGRELRALGLTSKDVNEGLANYIATTGGRTREEMADRAGLAKGAKEYMTQLDSLAQITGKNKDELEKEQKARQGNAAYQAALMNMTEPQRKSMEQAMTEMRTKFGKAGEDMAMAQALGIPPMTEASQKLQAMAPEVAAVSQSMVDNARAGGDLASQQRLSAKATEAAVVASKRFENQQGALSMQSGSTSEAAMAILKARNAAEQQGTQTAEKGEKQLKEIADNRAKREKGEADKAAQTEKTLQDLGTTILEQLQPALKFVTEWIAKFAEMISSALTWFNGLEGSTQKLILAVGGGVAVLASLFATGAVAKKLLGIGQPGGSASKPMFVQPVGSGGLASEAGLGEKAGNKQTKTGGVKKPGIGGKLLGGLKGGIGGMLGGLALGAAADYAAENGHEKTAAGLEVGQTAANWAGMGAMVGSVIPGAGTVVGGALGGLAGGAYGLWQNRSKFFGSNDTKNKLDPNGAVNTSGLPPMPADAALKMAAESNAMPAMGAESGVDPFATLNKHMADVVRYTKETAENSRRTVDAVKAMGGDLFKI
jgi:hypothetical protein